jgi:hypothetical protein
MNLSQTKACVSGQSKTACLPCFAECLGGEGGRVSRGGADHSAVSFRTLGAAYVTSINHIQLGPQDRSRFVMIDLGQLPITSDPLKMMSRLEVIEKSIRALSQRLRGRILAQSERWDESQAVIAAAARSEGADARQADTAATILAGRDLALFDDDIDQVRLRALQPILMELVRDVEDPGAALGRVGVYVLPAKSAVAVRVGRHSPVSSIYANTKWKSGEHASALLKL